MKDTQEDRHDSAAIQLRQLGGSNRNVFTIPQEVYNSLPEETLKNIKYDDSNPQARIDLSYESNQLVIQYGLVEDRVPYPTVSVSKRMSVPHQFVASLEMSESKLQVSANSTGITVVPSQFTLNEFEERNLERLESTSVIKSKTNSSSKSENITEYLPRSAVKLLNWQDVTSVSMSVCLLPNNSLGLLVSPSTGSENELTRNFIDDENSKGMKFYIPTYLYYGLDINSHTLTYVYKGGERKSLLLG